MSTTLGSAAADLIALVLVCGIGLLVLCLAAGVIALLDRLGAARWWGDQ